MAGDEEGRKAGKEEGGRRKQGRGEAQVELFPPMPLEEWVDTKETLHRFVQIVGKIRLAASPRRNHWWTIAFHVTGRGVTTRPMGLVDGNPIFTIDFDFVDHRLVVAALDGRTESFSLAEHSVASFYRDTFAALDAVGVNVRLAHPYPFDLPDARRPFAEDTDHAAYDPAWVTRYWQVLTQVSLVLEEFAGGFSGKTSPVHHFWHTFDIAVTRFSDRRVDQAESTDSVTREAYSREVISSGFWFGDDNVPEAAFYSYTAPEPEGLPEEPLRPDAAAWIPSGGSHLALYRYRDAREAADPRHAVLDFFESAYAAGARRANWPRDALDAPGGITDPVLRDARGTSQDPPHQGGVAR
jgi:hypothetical protein